MIIRIAKKEDANILDSLFAKLLDNERLNHDENIKDNLTMNGFFERRIGKDNFIVLLAEVDKDIVRIYLWVY